MLNRETIEAIENASILVNNHDLIAELQSSLTAAPRDLRRLRCSVREVLRRDPPAFVDRIDVHRGARFSYAADQFLKFVTDPLPAGLSTDVDTLRRLLGDGPERIIFEQAIDRGRGGANNPAGVNQHTEEGGEVVNHDNVMVDLPTPHPTPVPEQGNSVSYAIRRLARAGRTDLLERIAAGEISAHAAMIEAGFRKVPTILDVLQKAFVKATAQEREEFYASMGEAERTHLIAWLKHNGWITQ